MWIDLAPHTQMLFKLVVITVLVIAESADTCIKTVSTCVFIFLSVCPFHTFFKIFCVQIFMSTDAEKLSCSSSYASDHGLSEKWPELCATSKVSLINVVIVSLLTCVDVTLGTCWLVVQMLWIFALSFGAVVRFTRNTEVGGNVWRSYQVLYRGCYEWGASHSTLFCVWVIRVFANVSECR